MHRYFRTKTNKAHAPGTFKTMFDELTQALQTILLRLDRDSSARFVPAASSFHNIQTNAIPSHVRISHRKPVGPRLSEQFGRNTTPTSRLLTAQWPQDSLVEISVPVLVFVLSGQTDLRVADYILHCQVGDVIMIPPNVASAGGQLSHLDEPSEGKSCDLLWIQPVLGAKTGGGVQCYACRSENTTHSNLWNHGSCHIQHPSSRQILETLFEEIEESQSSILAYVLLKSLIHIIIREIQFNRTAPMSGTLPLHQPLVQDSDSIEYIKSYIDTHLHQALTIDLLAKRTYLSRAAFTTRFREQTGKTVNKYLSDLRVERAAVLLVETPLTIQKIAHTVGLQERQLRNLFHQYYQCSPLEWRSQKK
jgi:AraC-like DNA-binding protein